MGQDSVAKYLQTISEVATLPEVSMRIMQMLEDPDTEAKDLEDVFREDPALSSKLLKLANSPFYGLSRQVADVGRAIVLLGFNAAKALALSSSVGSMFAVDAEGELFVPGHLWTHSLAVAVASRALFRAAGRPEADGAFLAGVMHDLGLLLEHQCRPQALADAVRAATANGSDFLQAERDQLGVDHCELGLAVAEKWHFPAVLANAMGYHHRPLEAPEEFHPVTCTLALADNMAAQLELGFADVKPTEGVPDWAADVLGLAPAQLDEVRGSLAEQVEPVCAAMGV